MTRFISHCKSNGLKGVWLHVYADNDVDLDVWRIKGYYKSDTVGSVSLRHSKLVQKYLRENGITRNHGLDDVEKYLLEIKKHPGTKTNIRNIENITLAADITTLPDSLDSANQDAEINIATSSDGFFAAKENEEIRRRHIDLSSSESG